MITAIEAYKLVRKGHESEVLVNCLDFGDFYGFRFIPPELVGKEYGGSCYFTVDKKDGHMSFTSPIRCMDLYRKAKHIDISIFEE